MGGSCKATLPKIGESSCTRQVEMSQRALCIFIQFIPRITFITWPSKIIIMVGNTRPRNSSLILWTIRSTTTRPPGVIIKYDTLVAQSENLAFRAQAKLIKSCDTLEVNKMMMGCSNRKNIPESTSSLAGISVTMV
jgi:hypothetical protein